MTKLKVAVLVVGCVCELATSTISTSGSLGGFTTLAHKIEYTGSGRHYAFNKDVKPGNYYHNVLIYISAQECINNTIGKRSSSKNGWHFEGCKNNRGMKIWALTDEIKECEYDDDPCDPITIVPYNEVLYNYGDFYSIFEQPHCTGTAYGSCFSLSISKDSAGWNHIYDTGYIGGKYTRYNYGGIYVLENCYFWKEVQNTACAWSGEYPKQKIFLFDRCISLEDWAVENSPKIN